MKAIHMKGGRRGIYGARGLLPQIHDKDKVCWCTVCNKKMQMDGDRAGHNDRHPEPTCHLCRDEPQDWHWDLDPPLRVNEMAHYNQLTRKGVPVSSELQARIMDAIRKTAVYQLETTNAYGRTLPIDPDPKWIRTRRAYAIRLLGNIGNREDAPVGINPGRSLLVRRTVERNATKRGQEYRNDGN